MTHRSSHRDDPAHPDHDGAPTRGWRTFDRAAVREVDRLAIEQYGIPGIVLMENAAFALRHHALEMLGSHVGEASVAIICGPGNNGGDGYALARLLHNRDVSVQLAALGEPRDGSDAATNAHICRRMGRPVVEINRPDDLRPCAEAQLIVDAMLGTGLDRTVEGLPAEAIAWLNQTRRPVLAVDIPSGLNCDSGQPMGIAVRAKRTVTFVGLKRGFMNLKAQDYLGEVHVADIGAPIDLVRKLGAAPADVRHVDESSD